MDNEPPWLDDEEQQVWLHLSLLMTRLPAALERQLQRDAGLSLYEYLLLSGLSMTPARRLRLRDLAEFTGTSLSRLSNVISKLEGQGWVARTPDPQDGRSTFAVLTDAGYTKVVASAPGHVREVRRLVFDPLTPAQLRRFGDSIRRILDVVDPRGCDPEALLRAETPTSPQPTVQLPSNVARDKGRFSVSRQGTVPCPKLSREGEIPASTPKPASERRAPRTAAQADNRRPRGAVAGRVQGRPATTSSTAAP